MANNRPKSKKRDRSKSISNAQPLSYSQYMSRGEGATAESTAQAANVERSARAVAATGKGSNTVEWQNEYGHILNDLKTLLIVSVFLFAAMIGAGLLF